jgi:hypothetical protein
MSLQMSHLAAHDSLTDLPNRVLLNDRLTQAIASARRHGHQLTVLFLDLDRFKHVNDSLGHEIGDKLLQSVVGRLMTCVRRSDTVSRQAEMNSCSCCRRSNTRRMRPPAHKRRSGRWRGHITSPTTISILLSASV